MHDDDRCVECGDLIAVDLLMRFPRPDLCELCAHDDDEE